jgi:hypothetical protein
MPNSRAHELAERFAGLNEELVTFVQECPRSVWQSPCPDDGRSVGVVAHHIASSHAPLVQLMMVVANGEPAPSLTGAMLDQANADHTARHANCTPEEVIDLLRTDGRAAAEAIRSLNEEQLVRRASGELFGARMSVAELVENVLIGHMVLHFASMKDATEAATVRN